ncbi:MAG: glycosyltransferase family 39 protein [Myxococcales bacterium]|nr:glycosyltransferase family 39 protein [Myxococcales bacterium]
MKKRSSCRATLIVALVALASRLFVTAWAWGRIGPVADGVYYQIHAERMAAGLGYTWAWPDGTVTAAGHYPVGYPALVSVVYRVLGAAPGGAMLLNAALGTFGAVAIHRAALVTTSPRAALAAGLVFALHPGLVSYTPALMTEGVTAALIAVALWAATTLPESRRRWLALAALGAIVGAATLIRPQSLLLAPLFVWVALPGISFARRGAWSAAALVAALAVVLPWTARNCNAMGRCALVSVNGGWNLLIGTDAEAKGSWAPIKVPAECESELAEARKDLCFERAAWQRIGAEPLAWAALAPKKLSATFDYCGAGAWYLHEASPEDFGSKAKLVLGVLETFIQRALLALALIAAVRARERGWGWATPGRVRFAAVGFALVPWAWLGVLLFSALGLTLPASTAKPARVALGLSAMTTATTALIHVIFFGAGRYGLVIVPAMVLGAAALRWPFDTAAQNPDD